MNYHKISILLCIVIIIAACNPENIRRSRLQDNRGESQPDSFLYYQPMAISDPFLDSLQSSKGQEVAIKVRLIPPPPPPAPTTKQISGFRIQTFAGLDSLNALTSVEKLKSVISDSIYFFKEKGLFKIQFGDFLYRNDADLKVLDIRKNEISGAWVVATMIEVPIDSALQETTSDSLVQKEAAYKIQVLVTADELKAEQLKNDLEQQFKLESYFIESNKLFKVFLGKFETREQAEKILKKVKESGYPDAWLVYKS